jgi:N utilization substance protein A
MEVIVNEDQLSLAIGKRGQNVRLATRLVGWDIDIVSEELLKREIAQQMGKMMASGEAVPITALEGVTTAQAETLKEKGVADVEALAATSVDDLVDFLDLSLDEAERIIGSAKSIVDARNAQSGTKEEATSEDETETPEKSAEEMTESSEIAAEEIPETEETVESGEAETENATEVLESEATGDTENDESEMILEVPQDVSETVSQNTISEESDDFLEVSAPETDKE